MHVHVDQHLHPWCSLVCQSESREFGWLPGACSIMLVNTAIRQTDTCTLNTQHVNVPLFFNLLDCLCNQYFETLWQYYWLHTFIFIHFKHHFDDNCKCDFNWKKELWRTYSVWHKCEMYTTNHHNEWLRLLHQSLSSIHNINIIFHLIHIQEVKPGRPSAWTCFFFLHGHA